MQRLVELHGGTVEAKSKGHGMGSQFSIRLPVILSLADTPGETHQTGSLSGTHPSPNPDRQRQNRDSAVTLGDDVKNDG